jgi:chromosome segregation ATPase
MQAAMSLLGIISLLIHTNEAAVLSHGRALRRQHRLEASARRKSGKQARPALVEAFTEVSFAADASPANVSDPDFTALDQAAREDFKRRCEVLVTVSDEKFLPVKPLVRFCQSTDAPMECRLKVSMRLKETHARDDDMGQFCSAVYDWFESKYGMKCPKQCRKLQCRSTCLWLDAKKEANEENLQIKEEMQEAEEKLQYMRSLAKNITAKEAEEKKRNFTMSMSDTRVSRAQKHLSEREADEKSGQEKLDKIDEKVAEIETNVTIQKDNLIKIEDSITKQTFALDQAKLKLEDMLRTKERLIDKTEEQEKEEKSLKGESEKIDKEMEQLKAEKDKYAKRVAEDTKTASDLQGDLDDRVAKVKTAWKELDEFRKETFAAPSGSDWAETAQKWIHGDYVDDARVPETKELVKNQYQRAKEAEQALDDQNQKIKDIQQTMSDIDRQTSQYGEEKAKVQEAEKKAKDAATQLKDDTKKQEDAIKDHKENQIEKPLEVLKKTKADKAAALASLASAKRTLKFTTDLQRQQKSHLHALSGYVSQAHMALDNENKALETSKGALAKIQEELKALTDEEKAKKAEMETMESGMMTRIKVYKERAKALHAKRPEIVRLHGLEPKM